MCVFASTGGSLTKLAYYSTVQHKVAKVRSFDHATKVIHLVKEGYSLGKSNNVHICCFSFATPDSSEGRHERQSILL